jgi:serine/threonine-protein phosphatase 2A regulatory subunit A
LTLEIVQSDILEQLLRLALDPIPNIRFNVSKSLEVLAITFGKTPEGLGVVQQRIVPTLEQQKNDQDADVRYFAVRALQKTPKVRSFFIYPESMTLIYYLPQGI